MSGKAIRVRGTVQGVGFRPYIWHLARQYQLQGSVWNDEQGVMIHVWGDTEHISSFIEQIPLQLPPLATVLSIESAALNSQPEQDGFDIIASQDHHPPHTLIAADAAVCPECLAEINNPADRRFQYPFTNCTHCGPRLSIIKRIPYDRCNTSMAEFIMCPSCQQEYGAPDNRRFHAQANCCPDCGPQAWLEDNATHRINTANVIQQAALLIQQGHIIAIKGIGGFHLACDATNESAVAALRERKGRYAKPFALMAKDIAMVERYAQLDKLEQQALSDKTAPIVILPAKENQLAASVAPNEISLGFILPYTPLHSLLMQCLGYPVVMTSGNISEEPQCISNQQAREKLHGIADYFLLHNREIINRLDDSVTRRLSDEMRVLRRARGYSPEVLILPAGFKAQPQILALGGELKNSFCLLKDGMAIVSQHIGDLESAATLADYRQQLTLYQQLFDFKAELIAVDLHPNYLSTQYGEQLAQKHSLPLHTVQHHHAHIAACMAEHGLPFDSEPVLAAVFDGLGMGLEGQLWGGEFLLSDYSSCTRLGHFQPIAMPGGVQSIREPWRSAYAQLNHYFDFAKIKADYADLEIFKCLADKPLAPLSTMIEKGLNSPLSSSCGRWFDAFAAVLNLCPERVSYEGQAAMELESLAAREFSRQVNNAYLYHIEQQQGVFIINWQPLWLAVLTELQDQQEKAVIAARIHHTLSAATVELLMKLADQTRTNTIVLSGGVFQNRLLLESVTEKLKLQGKTVLSAEKYPLNDGGIALGQALIAASRYYKR